MLAPRLTLVALSLAACGSPAADPDLSLPTRTELAERTDVPLDPEIGAPCAPVVLPGLGEGTFLVDTGAESTWLDAGFARRCGLEVRRFRVPILGVGVDSQAEFGSYAVVPRLELGALAAFDVVTPLRDLELFPLEIDGILGQDVLRGQVVVFDAANARMILLPAGDVTEHLRALFAPGTGAARFEVDWSDGVPVLELGFGELGRFPFTVDTGATSSTFPRAVVDSLGLPFEGTTESFAIAGAREVKRYRIEALSIDAIEIQDLLVDATDAPRGLFGWDPIGRFVAILDGPGGTFWLLHEPEWN